MALKVEIKKEEVGDDPPIVTYHVTLTDEGGIWKERFTLQELLAFRRGFDARKYMGGMGDSAASWEIPI